MSSCSELHSHEAAAQEDDYRQIQLSLPPDKTQQANPSGPTGLVIGFIANEANLAGVRAEQRELNRQVRAMRDCNLPIASSLKKTALSERTIARITRENPSAAPAYHTRV